MTASAGASAGESRRALLKGARCYVAAYGCARAWATLTFTGPWRFPAPGFDPHVTFDVSYIAVSLIVALLFRRLIPLNEQRWLRRLVLGCMVGASVGCIAVALAPGAAAPLAAAASLIAGLGYGLFLLLAAEVLCSFSLLRIFLFMTGAMLLGVGLAFLCQGMAGPQLSVALVALPLLAMAYLRRAYEGIPLVERPRRTVPRFSYPWKLFALYALYAFAYGLRANLLVEGAGTHSSISTALVVGVLFLSAYYFAGRFNIGALYRSPVLLMVCGFLLIPMEGLFGAAASSYLIAVSYSLMGLLVTFLLYDISKRMGVAIVAFMACKNAEQFFVQAGSAATDALGMSGLPADTQSLVVAILVCVLILGATLVLFSERELSSKWGVDILATGGLVERSEEEERREERCRELVETYHLSPREEEVLLLLAEGKTGRVIQQELFIAEGTFKAHTRHIYEKMSINTRKELLDLLGL